MSVDRSPGKVLITGGGTAGHLLPGVAVADALVRAGLTKEEITFAGGDRGVERQILGDASYPLVELPGRGIQRRLTVSNVTAAVALARGLVGGIRLVRRLRPDVVLTLGGYASFSCGVGAVISRRPLVLCEQNARAGAVNRLLRHWARKSVVSFEGTDLPRAVVTGNPLRTELVKALQDLDAEPARRRREACARLELPADRIVVLVTTGSLGSRTVNDAVVDLAFRWRDRRDVAIRHVTGRRDFGSIVDRTSELCRSDPHRGLIYQVVEYEDHMDVALSAADLAVTRAGGGVAELAAFGVPAVLVPLPIAPRDHQSANARALADAGGAVVLDDARCDGDHLEELVASIVADESKRGAMAKAMRAAARPHAADDAAAVLLEVIRGN